MNTDQNLRTAARFARALDEDDYATAASLVSDDCLYESPDGLLAGPVAIMQSYSDNSDSARTEFDAIEYRSEVRLTAPDVAEVIFTDVITRLGLTHTYRCMQILHINEHARISRIKHQELPGERRALEAFTNRVESQDS